MEFLHDKHHQGYVDGANTALDMLEQVRENNDYGDITGVERNLAFKPSEYVNHTYYLQYETAATGTSTTSGMSLTGMMSPSITTKQKTRTWSASTPTNSHIATGLLLHVRFFTAST